MTVACQACEKQRILLLETTLAFAADKHRPPRSRHQRAEHDHETTSSVIRKALREYLKVA